MTLSADVPPTTTPTNGPLAQFLLHPDRTSGSIAESAMHTVESAMHAVEQRAPIIVGTTLVIVLVVSLVRQSRTRRLHTDARMLEISLPPQVDANGAVIFWTNLHDLLRPKWRRLIEGQPHLVFEFAWTGPAMAVRLWAPGSISLSLLERAVGAAWPGAAVVECPSVVEPFPDDALVLGGELRLHMPEWFSIKTDHDIDPLRAVIGGVGDLGDHQGAVVQVLARPVTGRRTVRCLRVATALRANRSPSRWLRLLDLITPRGHGSTTAVADDPNRAADIRAILVKAADLGWEVVVRYGVSDMRGPNRLVRNQLKGRAHGVASTFALYCGRNRFARRKLRHADGMLRQRRFGKGDLLSVPELAVVAHLPTDAVLPGVSRAGARSVAPAATLSSSGKVIGDAESGTRRPVAVSPLDGRYHFHVLGSTGSGKSTLLTNLVLQDVAGGRGAVVIDPKGDLIVDILERLPKEAASRVRLLDPTRQELAPALDVLATRADNKHLVVDNIVGIFGRIFEAYWGPRTDDILRAACLTLVRRTHPAPSLVEVPLLLSDPDYRRRATEGIGDPVGLGGFWSWYESMSESQQAQAVGPVMNKLRAFLMRDFVRKVVGPGDNALRMENVLDGELLLVRIPKGIVGDEAAKLIGSLIVAKVWQAATARSMQSGSARKDAALYVDECQNFLNLPRSFDEMLAEARGYGLSLTLAHQHLGQLSRDLRDAISANARNKVFFNMSPEDAHMLQRHYLPELGEHDLSHLGAYQVALRCVVDGKEQPACTITTRPAPKSRNDNGQLIIDALARKRRSSNDGSGDASGGNRRSDDVAAAQLHPSLRREDA